MKAWPTLSGALCVAAAALPACRASVDLGGAAEDAGADAADDAGCPPGQCDPHNCGAPGHDCLGATCSYGVCAPFDLETDETGLLALDDTNVYFANEQGVRGVPKSGGAVFQVAPTPAAPPPHHERNSYALLLSGTTLYWASVAYGQAADAALFEDSMLQSMPATDRGTPGTTLFERTDRGFVGLGVAGPTLYGLIACGGLSSAPVAGGTLTTIAPDSCTGLEYWPRAAWTGAFAFDGADSFVFALGYDASAAAHSITRISIADGTVTSIPVTTLDPQGGGAVLAVAAAAGGGTLFTLVEATDLTVSLYASALDGTGARRIARAAGPPPMSSVPMTVDGTAAYLLWGDSVSRIDLATGDVLPLYRPPATLPSGNPPFIDQLALDDRFLYIGLVGILRVAK